VSRVVHHAGLGADDEAVAAEVDEAVLHVLARGQVHRERDAEDGLDVPARTVGRVRLALEGWCPDDVHRQARHRVAPAAARGGGTLAVEQAVPAPFSPCLTDLGAGGAPEELEGADVARRDGVHLAPDVLELQRRAVRDIGVGVGVAGAQEVHPRREVAPAARLELLGRRGGRSLRGQRQGCDHEHAGAASGPPVARGGQGRGAGQGGGVHGREWHRLSGRPRGTGRDVACAAKGQTRAPHPSVSRCLRRASRQSRDPGIMRCSPVPRPPLGSDRVCARRPPARRALAGGARAALHPLERAGLFRRGCALPWRRWRTLNPSRPLGRGTGYTLRVVQQPARVGAVACRIAGRGPSGGLRGGQFPVAWKRHPCRLRAQGARVCLPG
jgi:hypothetical protein